MDDRAIACPGTNVFGLDTPGTDSSLQRIMEILLKTRLLQSLGICTLESNKNQTITRSGNEASLWHDLLNFNQPGVSAVCVGVTQQGSQY